MLELVVYILLLVVAGYRYYYSSDHFYNYHINNPIVFSNYDKLLSGFNPYYSKLTQLGKHRFINRCINIRDNLIFQGREGFTVTKENEILISACLTQLTFGLRKESMPFIDGVVVFPEVFYSRLAGNWVKGLAMGNGVVFISWADFVEGYKDSTDTFNLGLHEFAHMMKMQVTEHGGGDEDLNTYFEKYQDLAYQTFVELREGNETFFREYGATNTSEFFSVCVENFFEVPQAFCLKLPELYYHLCYLLNQNPLNYTNDYQLTEEDIVEINQEIENDLPQFRLRHFGWVYSFWQLYSRVSLFVVFFTLLVNYQLPWDMIYTLFRQLGVTILLFALVRFIYYKRFSALFKFTYLNHLFLEILPIMFWIFLFINLATL